MGERKKKRGQLREVIVPLPLDSAFNRLSNRAAQQQCTVTMNVRKTDLKEADLAIGLFSRSGRRSGFNEIWLTTLTLEQLDAATTRIEYSPIRLSILIGFQAILPLLIPALCILCFSITLFNPNITPGAYPIVQYILFVAFAIIAVIYVRHRRQILENLLHNLDKPLGEN